MISEQELNDVVSFVKDRGISEQVIAELRNKYDGKHFTYCFEDDINVGRPVAENESFLVFLVDSREHCSKLTNDLSIASGYVFAEILGD